MNWVSLVNGLRLFSLFIFAVGSLGLRLNWFEDYAVLSKDAINKTLIFVIVIYGILYIVELKLIVKQKNKELAMLKTRLLQHEK